MKLRVGDKFEDTSGRFWKRSCHAERIALFFRRVKAEILRYAKESGVPKRQDGWRKWVETQI